MESDLKKPLLESQELEMMEDSKLFKLPQLYPYQFNFKENISDYP